MRELEKVRRKAALRQADGVEALPQLRVRQDPLAEGLHGVVEAQEQAVDVLQGPWSCPGDCLSDPKKAR